MEFYFYFRLFTKMPNEHYMEVAHMLLSVAGEDIERPDEIRTAVKVNPLINVQYNWHNTEFLAKRMKIGCWISSPLAP